MIELLTERSITPTTGRLIDGSDFSATRESLPDCTDLFDSRHVAQASELRRLVSALPIGPGCRVLDVPCGDGFFARGLAEAVRPTGQVAAVDLNSRILREYVPRNVEGAPVPVRSYVADAMALPFRDGSFDAAWCAHSLISLPDPAKALLEMRRVVRRGGAVGILENDVFHDILLPWPPDLELSLCRAEREFCRQQGRSATELHKGRQLGRIVTDAGLQLVNRQTYAVDRDAPLSTADERFVTLYLQGLWQRVRGFLPVRNRDTLARLIDPDGKDFLPHQPHFAMTCLDVLAIAEV